MSEKSTHVQQSGADTEAYPAQKARQGEIILRKRWQRIAFVGGLIGLVTIGLLAAFLFGH